MIKKFLKLFLTAYFFISLGVYTYYYIQGKQIEVDTTLKLLDIIEAQSDKGMVLSLENVLNDPMFNTIVQMFFIVIISSWSRAAGPRSRVDFLSDITWKKILFLIVLGLLLIVLVHLYV